jgi:hypothetical protein
VARNRSDADLVGPDAERLPPFEEVVRLVRLRILVPRIVVSAELSQPWQLAAAAVYWRSCGTGHGGECADVVDVTVRDKHCDRFELPLLDHVKDAGGFGARVDDQARRLVRAAHQVAIRLEWADGELEGSGDDRRLLGCEVGRKRPQTAALSEQV